MKAFFFFFSSSFSDSDFGFYYLLAILYYAFLDFVTANWLPRDLHAHFPHCFKLTSSRN